MPKVLSLAKPASSRTMVIGAVPVDFQALSLPSARQLLPAVGAPAPRIWLKTCCSVCSLPGEPNVHVEAKALTDSRLRPAIAPSATQWREKCRIENPSSPAVVLRPRSDDARRM